MHRKPTLVPLLLATVVAATACQREQPAAPAGPAAEATAPAPASAAVPAPTVAAAPVAIDATTLPGIFLATLPCADCPAIDVRLELHPDGRFVLTQVMQEHKDGTTVQQGSWALDADKRLHLQPEGGAELLYAVDAIDRLTQLGRDGQRSGSGSDAVLTRVPRG